MVSKNLSVCLSVTKFDPNYLRTGRTEWAEIFWGEKSLQLLAARAVFESLFFLQKQLIYGFLAGNNYPDLPHSQGQRVWNLPHKYNLYLIFKLQYCNNRKMEVRNEHYPI